MLKSSLFFIVFFSLVNLGITQTTFTVDQTSLGIGTSGGVIGSLDTDGSLDVMLTNALLSANAGNSVIVNLDASGLVLVTAQLPVIKVSNSFGKLTIQKKPAATIEQGIKFYSGTIEGGFIISDCSGDVEIKNLRIEGFLRGISGTGKLFAGTPGDLLVSNNYFYSNYIGVYFGTGNYAKVDLLNNTIECFPGGVYSLTWGIDLVLRDDQDRPTDYATANFTIDNNTISYYKYGLRMLHFEKVTKNKATVTITDNELSNCYDGITLANPKKSYYELSNNSLSNMVGYGLVLTTHNYSGFSPFPCSFNLIESGNSLGLPTENNGNSFLECKTGSIWIESMDTVYIVGLNVQGSIVGVRGKPHYIRETLIEAPTDMETDFLTPIWWSGGSVNAGIPRPVPTSARIDGAELTLLYSLPGLNLVNAPFKVEYFKASADNSLIEYLGSETKTDASIGLHTKVFTGLALDEDSKIGITVTSIGGQGIGTSMVGFVDPVTTPCDTCFSFQPVPGKRYWISAWVHEDHLEQVKSYEGANLQLNFITLALSSFVQFYPTGEIIDGWQRIVGEFTMPESVAELTVQLNAHPFVDTYFDDIRIHPYNGSMKSYVYDGQTFWLTSELDDNNYATFYEYDEEGGLIRIKKETSEGIVTIQETRSNTIKIVE